MSNILSNSWFVGITTGIISGALVFIISNWIMKKGGKEEYHKRVAEANEKVISSLKPYIAEKGLPDTEIFAAIISSVARACSVNSNDMYSIPTYCEELINEIISDVYVASDKKKEYSENLSEYKKKITSTLESKPSTVSKTDFINQTQTIRRKVSILFSLISTTLAGALSLHLYGTMDPNEFWYPFNGREFLWIPIVVIAIVALFACFSLVIDLIISTPSIIKSDLPQKKDSEADNPSKSDIKTDTP